jgi:HD-like signal output (HDOD) protein
MIERSGASSRPRDGARGPAWAAPDPQASIADTARSLVRRGVLELQPLPAVALRVLGLIQKEDDCDTTALAVLTERDPALTARLLHAANASIYAGLRAVEEVHQAIVRLGYRQVRQLLSAVVMKFAYAPVQGPRAELLEKLWEHALATAIGARHVGRLTGGESAHDFLAGLLHDTGRMLVLRTVAEIEKRPTGPPITPALLDELMDELHAELGHAALTGWRVAAPVCEVARDHHRTDVPESNRLLLRVQVANHLARRIGFHPHPDPELKLLSVPAVERLGLDDLQLATLAIDVEDEVRATLEAL